MDTIHTNGFVQCIHKATRIQNKSRSLLDHILTNSQSKAISSGSFISDISDHFLTFIQLPLNCKNEKPKCVESRNFSDANIQKFKDSLASQSWENVLQSKNVDSSYASFWGTFGDLFEIHFPLKKTNFNKNFHKINNYVTSGLFISITTKIKLHKLSIYYNIAIRSELLADF